MSKTAYSNLCLLSLALSLSTSSCFASKVRGTYPGLVMHGEHYPNSCNPEGLDLLRETVLERKFKNTQQAWQLIGAMLCAPNDAKNHAYVKQFSNKQIKLSYEATGEKPVVRTAELNDELVDEIIAAGNVWKASVRVESKKIVFHYFANEACVKCATLLFRSGSWSIHEFGVACD